MSQGAIKTPLQKKSNKKNSSSKDQEVLYEKVEKPKDKAEMKQ